MTGTFTETLTPNTISFSARCFNLDLTSILSFIIYTSFNLKQVASEISDAISAQKMEMDQKDRTLEMIKKSMVSKAFLFPFFFF